MANLVLGVSGGIAAFKAAELARLFVKAGVAVDVVMTEAATRFVTPMTFQALTGRPVATDLWHSGASNAMDPNQRYDDVLLDWIEHARRFVETLPPK